MTVLGHELRGQVGSNLVLLAKVANLRDPGRSFRILIGLKQASQLGRVARQREGICLILELVAFKHHLVQLLVNKLGAFLGGFGSRVVLNPH